MTNLRRFIGTTGIVAVLAAGSAAAVAVPAGAVPATAEPAATAATLTVFTLDGIYTDGGSARPRISDNDDLLTVDMSSQGRPTAKGAVVNSDTISVTFPDDATYEAKLTAPGTIRWANGSTWTKLATTIVPDVRDALAKSARDAVLAAGLTPDVKPYPTCETRPGRVDHQQPANGTQVEVGATVRLFVAVKPQPPTVCG